MPAKVLGLIVFIFFLFQFSFSVADGQLNLKVTRSEKIYSVIEFESTFMNKKKEKVLKILGEPDAQSEHRGKKIWKYNRIIKDQGKLWDQSLLFNFGRVNMMWGNPTGEG
jgi:hypothetical protein